VDGDAVGWVIRMGLGAGMGRKLGSLELETCSAGLLLLDCCCWTGLLGLCAALLCASRRLFLSKFGRVGLGARIGTGLGRDGNWPGSERQWGFGFWSSGLVRLVNSGLVWLFISLRFRVGAGAGAGTGAVAAGPD